MRWLIITLAMVFLTFNIALAVVWNVDVSDGVSLNHWSIDYIPEVSLIEASGINTTYIAESNYSEYCNYWDELDTPEDINITRLMLANLGFGNYNLYDINELRSNSFETVGSGIVGEDLDVLGDLFVSGNFSILGNLEVNDLIVNGRYIPRDQGYSGYRLRMLLHADSESIDGITGVKDMSGDGNDGTDGNFYYTGGKLGQGFGFNGSGTYVRLESDSFNTITHSGQEFTLGAWVYLNDTKTGLGSTEVMLAQQDGSGNGRSWMALRGSQCGYSKYESFLGGSSFCSASNVKPFEWVHVVVRYNGTLAIFIDGVEENSTTKNIDEGATGDFILGAVKGLGMQFFNGSIDEIFVYNRSLSNDEIKVIYEMNTEMQSHKAYIRIQDIHGWETSNISIYDIFADYGYITSLEASSITTETLIVTLGSTFGDVANFMKNVTFYKSINVQNEVNTSNVFVRNKIFGSKGQNLDMTQSNRINVNSGSIAINGNDLVMNHNKGINCNYLSSNCTFNIYNAQPSRGTNVVVEGSVTAFEFIDLTPAWDGSEDDALDSIRMIETETELGSKEIDHESYPEIAKVDTKKIVSSEEVEICDEKTKECYTETEVTYEEVKGRSLGGIVTVLIEAVKSLANTNDNQDLEILELQTKVSLLETELCAKDSSYTFCKTSEVVR